MISRLTIVTPWKQLATAAQQGDYRYDTWLLGAVLLLLGIGLVMMGSASVSIADKLYHEPFYYIWRQLGYISVALLLSWVVLHIPVEFWNRIGTQLLIGGVVLLMLVLLVGKQINGSVRWIDLGIFKIQPSELVKLFVVVFVAGYMLRRGDEVRTSIKGFFKPMLIVGLIGILLLLEPDFGSAVVISLTVLGMMFLGGVRLWQFGLLILMMSFGLMLLAFSSPERMERLTSFINPWADPFGGGFQLTQALIAFGRGEWFGVGLGGSVQKLFYLPEAHTDFLFAVISEETGLLGGVSVIALFIVVVYRALRIGHIALENGDRFAGYLAFGLGLLIGIQVLINIGVNMGMLPTKGLTLPLMSYGGSSIVATCMACAMILRVAHQYPDRNSPYTSTGKNRRKRLKGKNH